MFYLADVTTNNLGDTATIVGWLITAAGIGIAYGVMRSQVKSLENESEKWESRCAKHREEFLTVQTSANTEFREAVKAILSICTEIKVGMAATQGDIGKLGIRLDALDRRIDEMGKRVDEVMLERTTHQDSFDRGERADRYDRADRADRADRSERADRKQPDKK